MTIFTKTMRFLVTLILLTAGISMKAATITYSLTTHEVFGYSYDITGTASLSAGDNLLDNMPQAFWRAYTTYKFFSDAAMTQEITEAPSGNATVYVDYVFDPYFIPSIEGEDPVWLYLRGYNYTGKATFLLYKKKNTDDVYGWKYESGVMPKPGTNNQMDEANHHKWAIYGDGFNLQIKLNDADEDLWLVWRDATPSFFNPNPKPNVRVSERPQKGWQLYANAATNSKFPNGGMASLVVPDTDPKYVFELTDVDGVCHTTKLDDSEFKYTDQNVLYGVQQGNMNYNNEVWWLTVFATPTMATNPIIYHVTYKILMGYDNLKQRGNDIYEQKTSTAKEPNLADEYKLADTDEYKYTYYYFKDPELTEMWMPGETMPTNENTIVYVLEDRAISTTWKTLSLPAGFNPALINMEVLEYTSLTTTLATTGGYNFQLHFTPIDEVVEDKPYLYRFVDAGETIVAKFNEYLGSDFFNSFISEGETPIEVPQIDPAYPDVQVIMKGAFENVELTPQVEEEDPLYFYFGYNSVQEVYKFYPVTKNNVTMTPWKCYFFAVGVPEGSSVSFGMDDAVDGITAVSTEMGKNTSKGVYNINGQLVNTNGSTVGLPAGIYMVNGKKLVVK